MEHVDMEVTAFGVTFLVGRAVPRKPALRSCNRRVRCDPDPIAPDPLPDRRREAGLS